MHQSKIKMRSSTSWKIIAALIFGFAAGFLFSNLLGPQSHHDTVVELRLCDQNIKSAEKTPETTSDSVVLHPRFLGVAKATPSSPNDGREAESTRTSSSITCPPEVKTVYLYTNCSDPHVVEVLEKMRPLKSNPVPLKPKPKAKNTKNNPLFPCTNVLPQPAIRQHGNFYVSYYHIPARKTFDCHETITYTTHAESNFLHNLITLLPRWQGPVSIALFTPGSDYEDALATIKYLRDCTDVGGLVKELVTFHFYFPHDHISEYFSSMSWKEYDSVVMECDIQTDEVLYVEEKFLYRTIHKLPYPINVARNIAKEAATTELVLPSDIELYPSQDLIKKFMAFIKRTPSYLTDVDRKNVFVLPVFELADGMKLNEMPETKEQLMETYQMGNASFFHFKFCRTCHMFSGQDRWIQELKSPESKLQVFKALKRRNPYWEPFYIGKKSVPFWDERLMWRQRNKIVQATAMCLQNYVFNIMDNAFLVHRPGIKVVKAVKNQKEDPATKKFFEGVLEPEMYSLYGKNEFCFRTKPKLEE